MRRALPMLLLLALTGCGESDNTPGTRSRSENRELDEAASQIDINAMDNTESAN